MTTRIDYQTFERFDKIPVELSAREKDDNSIEPMLYSTKQAAKLLGISRTLLYRLIGENTLKSSMLYGRRVITPKAIKEFIAGLDQ